MHGRVYDQKNLGEFIEHTVEGKLGDSEDLAIELSVALKEKGAIEFIKVHKEGS